MKRIFFVIIFALFSALLLSCKDYYCIIYGNCDLYNSKIAVFIDGKEIKQNDVIDFETIEAGNAKTLTFQIMNTGHVDLHLIGYPNIIEMVGTDKYNFSIKQPEKQIIIPNTNVTFEVTFNPLSYQQKNISISILNNSPDNDSFSFSVIGIAKGMSVLNNPQDNSTTNKTKPTFDWNAFPFPNVKYHIQIATDTGFFYIIEEVNNVTDIHHEINTTLQNDMAYYWRVSVIDENGYEGNFSPFNGFEVDLGMVDLLSPENQSSIVRTKPIFDWSDSILPNANYHIQIATDTGFFYIVEEANNLASSQYEVVSAILQNNATYYWRVSVIDENGIESGFSGFYSFNVYLGLVNLLIPSNESTINNTKPIFDWEDSTLPNAKYSIKISSDIDFTNIVLEDTNIETSEYIPSIALQNNTTYYWKIAAIDENGVMGDFTQHFYFGIIIETIQLIAPEENSLLIYSKPNFEWSMSTLPNTKYHIQISNDIEFENIIENTTNLTENHYTANSTLQNNGIYYWRVCVIDENGVESDFTNHFKFKIEMSIISLVSPQNNSIVNSNNPILSWTNSIYPNAKYRIQIATNSLFTNIIEENSNIQDLEYSVQTTLQNRTRYCWRVSVIDENGAESDFTNYSIFDVTLDPVILTSPVNSYPTNNRKPLFVWQPHEYANSYTLLISENDDLSNPILTKTGITETSYTLSDTEQLMGFIKTYYWGVKIVDGNNVSGNISEIRNLILDVVEPTISNIIINDGATETEDVILNIKLQGENGTGTPLNKIKIWHNLSEPIGWASYTSNQFDYILPSRMPDFITVCVKLKDLAGNEITNAYFRKITLKKGPVYVSQTHPTNNTQGTIANPFTAIQTGIDYINEHPESVSGELRVSAGTYYESIIIKKGVTNLYGGYHITNWKDRNNIDRENPIYKTVIQGMNEKAVSLNKDGFFLEKEIITIDGFVIKGYKNNTKLSAGIFSSDYVSNNISLNISNNTIQSGKCSENGSSYGVKIGYIHATISNNIIYGDEAMFSYGIDVSRGYSHTIENNLISSLDCGIYGMGSHESMIRNNEITSRISILFTSGNSVKEIYNNNLKCLNNDAVSWGIYINQHPFKIYNNETFKIRISGRSATNDPHLLCNNKIFGIDNGITTEPSDKDKNINIFNNIIIVKSSSPTNPIKVIYNNLTAVALTSNYKLYNNIMHTIGENSGVYSIYTDGQNSNNLKLNIKNNNLQGAINGGTIISNTGNTSLNLTNYFVDIDGPDNDINTMEDNDWRLKLNTPTSILNGGLDLSSEVNFPQNDDGIKIDFDGNIRTGNGTTGWTLGAYEIDVP